MVIIQFSTPNGAKEGIVIYDEMPEDKTEHVPSDCTIDKVYEIDDFFHVLPTERRLMVQY